MGAAEIEIAMPGPPPWPAHVGRYRIRGEIASGGMATVYLGVRDGESRLCAIKRVHPHLARQREFIEMFVDEARIGSRIRHANVCGVLEWGESDGTFFLAMEMLSGEPLIALLRALKKRPETLADPRWHRAVARVVADACAGLHAAHDSLDDDGEPLHVVHRDVSPHNLFVTWDGVAKVVDFGVASAKHRLHHTTTGMVKGKFAYMAPEQLQGAPVDRRADVWSLGVVLWELLAGRPLFRRAVETETIFAVLNEAIPALERASPAAPRELETIARRAITTDLDRRTPTADRMREELEDWLAREGGCDVHEVAALLAELLPGEKERAIARFERALEGASAIAPAPHDATGMTRAKSSGVQRKVGARPRVASLATASVLVLGAVGAAAALVSSGWVAGAERVRPEHPIETVDLAAPPATGSVVVPAPASSLAALPPPVLATTRETRARATTTEPIAAGAPGDAIEAARAPAPARPIRRAASTTPDAEDDGSGLGELDVATAGGWAEVWLDGRRLGHTPGRFRLPSGRHTLTLRPGAGGAEQRTSVRIVGGQLARLRVDLSR